MYSVAVVVDDFFDRIMVESHRHLNITPREWDAFMDDLQQTLNKFNVPAAEQADLRAIVQSTRDDIRCWRDVNRPA